MARTPAEDPRLVRLTAICLTLPEPVRAVHGNFADFRVRKKVFAYFLNDHDRDGIVSVCCKSELGENVDRATREPGRFYLPPYIGSRGWFGLRLDRTPIDWKEVENAVQLSYCLAAPKSLAKRCLATQVPRKQRPGVQPVSSTLATSCHERLVRREALGRGHRLGPDGGVLWCVVHSDRLDRLFPGC